MIRVSAVLLASALALGVAPVRAENVQDMLSDFATRAAGQPTQRDIQREEAIRRDQQERDRARWQQERYSRDRGYSEDRRLDQEQRELNARRRALEEDRTRQDGYYGSSR